MLRTTDTRSSKVFRRFLPVLSAPTTQPICSIFEPGPMEELPTELLQEVFQPLDRNSIRSCMRVCRRWYNIARPYYFAVLPVRHCHRQQAFKYLRSHPGLAARVTKLHFFYKSCGNSGNSRGGIPRGPFDIKLLVSALPLLTNLRALRFEGYDTALNRPSLLSRLLQTRQRQTSTVSLQRLSFEHCSSAASMVPELLSLFSVNTLVFDVHLSGHTLNPRETPVPSPIPPASITIQNLVFGRETHLRDHLSFFQPILVPGSLHGLAVSRCRKEGIPFIERFLQSGASRNLLSLSLTTVSQYAGTSETAVGANNAGPAICEALGAALKHCTRLRYVRLGFAHNGDGRSDLLSSRDTFRPILTNLPPTLRVFTIEIWLYTQQPWCCTSAPIALNVVDCMLAPSPRSRGGRGCRFFDLRRVEVNVYQDTTLSRATCMKPLEEHDPRPLLPRLDAAGLLRHGVGRIDHSKPYAEVYWPSEE